MVINPIHPIGNSSKEQKPCTIVQCLVLKLMGILWAHMGAIGCKVLETHL